jgi:hypothetical protein
VFGRSTGLFDAVPCRWRCRRVHRGACHIGV